MVMSLVLRGGDLECRLVCGELRELVLRAARAGLGCRRPGVWTAVNRWDEAGVRVVSALGTQPLGTQRHEDRRVKASCQRADI